MPEFESPFQGILLQSVDGCKDKTLVAIGIHDAEPIKSLAKHFKKVCSFYEFLKVKEEEGKKFCLKKEPFSETIKRLGDFDVILFMNEMHHLPAAQQLAVYEKLGKNQELILAEWNKKGSFEKFYRCFQDCGPLCDAARQILESAARRGIVSIEKTRIFKDHYHFETADGLRRFFRFILPDHYTAGELLFEKAIKSSKFPISLMEENRFYRIKKGNAGRK